jgi:hypothetical protein
VVGLTDGAPVFVIVPNEHGGGGPNGLDDNGLPAGVPISGESV